MPVIQQTPSIILPTVWVTGSETEIVNDLVVHTSIEFDVSFLQEKIIYITATEVVVFGVPGPLWAWVELSPYPTTTTGLYWGAINGGGGATVAGIPVIPPVAPTIEAPVGVNGTTHGILIPWAIHSNYARLRLQVPVAATPATAFWVVQATISGKAV
jgi:hypothetical protein